MARVLCMIVVVFVLLVVQCNCYSLRSTSSSLSSLSPSIQSLKHARLSNSKINSKLYLSAATAISISKSAATLPLIYMLMSFNEYITHRFYQHAEINKIAKVFGLNFKIRGGGHVEHHAETRDDMSLKTDEEAWRKTAAFTVLSEDKYRGTAFSWKVFGLMTLQMAVSTIPIFKYALGFSLPVTMLILMPAMLVHGSVWNTLHPAMHGLPDNNLAEGPPSNLFAKFRNSAYFKYIELNHIGHHIMPCNYNVCCPGTDFLFGTHVAESIWRKKQRIEDRTVKELVLN